MTEARAVLYSGTQQYEIPPSSAEEIPASYGLNKAEVFQGTWIFYDRSYKENNVKSKLVREGEKQVDLGFTCRSAREVQDKADGICLFEHGRYGGTMKVNDSTCTLTVCTCLFFESCMSC